MFEDKLCNLFNSLQSSDTLLAEKVYIKSLYGILQKLKSHCGPIINEIGELSCFSTSTDQPLKVLLLLRYQNDLNFH